MDERALLPNPRPASIPPVHRDQRHTRRSALDFGRLSHIDDVDFSLAPHEPRTAAVLDGARAVPPTVRLGAPAWGNASWVGRVYPRGTPPRDFLGIYASHFTAIELNSTFYGVPAPATVARWRDSTPPGFLFCPKVHQSVSRAGDLGAASAGLAAFCAAMEGFGDRLGPSFLQLPPAFGPDRIEALHTLLGAAPPSFPLAVELRHPGWFADRALRDDAWAMLRSRGIGAVITDVAGRRDVSHASLPVPWTLARLVLNALHPTDQLRIDAWATRLAEWLDAGLQGAFLFVHQPDDTLAPETLGLLADAVNARTALALPRWRPEPPPRQLTLQLNVPPQACPSPKPD